MIPQFSAISAKTNEPIDLPKSILWKSVLLDDDEAIVYIDEKGEKSIVTSRPFDDEKYYKIIIYDYRLDLTVGS